MPFRTRRTYHIDDMKTSIPTKAYRVLVVGVAIAIAAGIYLSIFRINLPPSDPYNNNQQASPTNSLSITDSVKIKLADEVMEWNGYSGSDSDQYSSYNLDPQQLATLRKTVSNEDKLKAYNILYDSLSRDQIKRLLVLSKGGITPTKKAEVKQILTSGLTRQDIEELRIIYDKYQP